MLTPLTNSFNRLLHDRGRLFPLVSREAAETAVATLGMDLAAAWYDMLLTGGYVGSCGPANPQALQALWSTLPFLPLGLVLGRNCGLFDAGATDGVLAEQDYGIVDAVTVKGLSEASEQCGTAVVLLGPISVRRARADRAKLRRGEPRTPVAHGVSGVRASGFVVSPVPGIGGVVVSELLSVRSPKRAREKALEAATLLGAIGDVRHVYGYVLRGSLGSTLTGRPAGLMGDWTALY